MAAEVGVKVESTGLACWAWDGCALRADEAKEDEEPDRQDVAIVVSRRVAGLLRVLRTPPFCAICCGTGIWRATGRLSRGWRCSN